MAPGFEWQSFELGEREVLLEQYPDFAEMIEARLG
jgi:predicted cupin superfamily sugar epimerase